MSQETPSTKAKSLNLGLGLLLLLFPLLGVIGFAIIVLNDNDADANPNAASLSDRPTPAPIIISPIPTARPTVTIRPILNNNPPEWEISDRESGEVFRLADLTGQIVVVNFWATWCLPCVREMPTLERFAADNPDVLVLAVTDPEDGQSTESIDNFIKDYNLEEMQIAYDTHGRLRINFNAVNLPMTFILDADNVVRFRQLGEVTREDLDHYLSELQG